MKLSITSLRVLRALLDDPGTAQYGYQLARRTGISSGGLFPVLARLEDERLVSGAWEEDVDPHVVQRPLRRYYQLTPAGLALARAELARMADELRPPAVPEQEEASDGAYQPVQTR